MKKKSHRLSKKKMIKKCSLLTLSSDVNVEKEMNETYDDENEKIYSHVSISNIHIIRTAKYAKYFEIEFPQTKHAMLCIPSPNLIFRVKTFLKQHKSTDLISET